VCLWAAESRLEPISSAGELHLAASPTRHKAPPASHLLLWCPHPKRQILLLLLLPLLLLVVVVVVEWCV
jgi:hypothetical protein